MTRKRYAVSICLLTKDENEYLNEWLEWHRNAGAEHFYIYDNGSKTPVADSIAPALLEWCTVVDFSGEHRHTQMDAYADCLSRFGAETEWMAFIDTDEFIRVYDGTPLPEFMTRFQDADCVALRWIVYGADGQPRRTAGGVRDRFHRTAEYPRDLPRCKSIIRTESGITMGAHFPSRYTRETVIVNEKGDPIKYAASPDITCETIAVDHYFTRSYEEWREKMTRGSCDPFCVRGNEWFLRINPDMREAVERYEAACARVDA